MTYSRIALGSALLIALGCNVEKTNDSTGGVEFGGAAGSGGEGGTETGGTAGNGGVTAAESTVTCDRGLVVVMSDWVSTNVGITALDGTVQSSSFISSGATDVGLSMALSGDVEVPRLAPQSGNVVLLDRYGTNVITWVALDSAEVLGQLPVGTGFESNPQDYLEYSSNRAVVSRLGTNSNPGQQDYDGGGDLLIVDTKTPEIVGRIAMPEDDESLQPRPSGMILLGNTVVVSLGRLSADFTTGGAGRFVGVSPTDQEILWTVDLEGVKNCGRLAVSPSGKLGAIACSSVADATTYQYNPDESDVVIFDLTVTPPKEVRRLGLGKAVDAGLQWPVEFASETKLIALAYGGNSVTGDRALAVDVETGDYQEILESEGPYALVGLHCAPGCGDICLVSDTSAGVLRRFQVSSEGEFTALDDITVDSTIGLPPRSIGAL